jgi:hypothetical protein
MEIVELRNINKQLVADKIELQVRTGLPARWPRWCGGCCVSLVTVASIINIVKARRGSAGDFGF